MSYEKLKEEFLNAKMNGDNATANNIRDIVNQNPNYVQQQQYQTEMQDVKDNFLNAKATGGSTDGMSQQYQTAYDNYTNALGGGVQAKPNVKQNFLDGYMKYMQDAMNQGKLSEQALANQKMEQDLLGQEQARRESEKNYTDTIGQIEQGTYNASEDAKVRGVQRGVMYSAQQAGVDAGIASRAISNKQQASEVRGLRLASITDKINAIKSGNLQEIQAIEAKYNSKLSEAMANAYLKGTEREWQLSDMQQQRDWTVEDRDLGYQHDKDMTDIKQKYTQDNMSLSQKYDLEKMDVQNTYDQQKIDKMFENDLTKMKIDQTYKKELANMDYAFKKEFLKLEGDQKANLMQLEFGQKKALMAMDEASRMRVLGAQQAYGREEMQARFANESNKVLKDMVGSIIMNDPNFTAYPTSNQQKKMMGDLFGVMSGEKSVKQFVSENYSSKTVNNASSFNQSVSIVDNILGKNKVKTNSNYNPGSIVDLSQFQY